MHDIIIFVDISYIIRYLEGDDKYLRPLKPKLLAKGIFRIQKLSTDFCLGHSPSNNAPPVYENSVMLTPVNHERKFSGYTAGFPLLRQKTILVTRQAVRIH